MPIDSSPNGEAPLGDKAAEISLPVSSRAPGAARRIVSLCLGGQVANQIRDDVDLLVSELVTNSVRHGELGDGDTVLVRVFIAADTLRVEIEDPGTTGVVARSRPDLRSTRGGFGLNLVDSLATRWGVSRRHGTTVWFETSRA
jgi:anti-sigma regulatory factor (Ser/Thr protein kinase)